MRIDVFGLFPDAMRPSLASSVLARAQAAGLVEIHLHNIRDFTSDRHQTTDDEPYGGGGGMVMKPEPIFTAVESVLGSEVESSRIVLLTPQGRVFDQGLAAELANVSRLVLLCGRYEGVDERVGQHLVDDEISIGDYVLTGGELPALLIVDAVVRLLPGALGDETASARDSHAAGLLEGPHYTRPAEYRGWEVPPVLRSGDHAKIADWRREQSLRRTLERRPDLLAEADLSEQDQQLLRRIREGGEPPDGP
ncbi:MAG: tRNA (guanosine(37)-N1)-methyltransferase TrmD [Anaerolineales bacterium]